MQYPLQLCHHAIQSSAGCVLAPDLSHEVKDTDLLPPGQYYRAILEISGNNV